MRVDPKDIVRLDLSVYAGIGSRRTPPDVLELMEYAAAALRALGWTLRSGHASGADQAFEGGAYRDAEVYLPWPSFEPDVAIEADLILDRPTDAAARIASQFHPNWSHLSRGPRALHARNSHQILGEHLDCQVKFVLCWTPDGSLDGSANNAGGTGQALRIAAAYDIPVFNLQRLDHRDRVESLIALVD